VKKYSKIKNQGQINLKKGVAKKFQKNSCVQKIFGLLVIAKCRNAFDKTAFPDFNAEIKNRICKLATLFLAMDVVSY